MAEAMTYDSLVNDIITYAERDDTPFVDQVPRFIMMCENRLASEIHGLGFLRAASTTLTGAILAKPARWRETESVSITASGSITYLQQREYQYCRAFNANSSSGVPRYYADYDYEHFFFAPAPDSNYTAEIMYYERPEPLSATNQTNWTTQYAPQLLLYGALLEAMPFLKTSERIPEFQQFYDRAAMAIAKEDEKRMRPDAAAVRS